MPALYAPGGGRLDAIDLELLRLLGGDGRMENQALAQAVELSPSACSSRVKRLEEQGAIRGYAALAEESIFEAWIVLWVQVTLRAGAQKRRAEFEVALHATREIIEAHAVAGRFDYLLKAALPTTTAWDALRMRLDPEDCFIESVDVFVGMRTAKANAPHPLLSLHDRAAAPVDSPV